MPMNTTARFFGMLLLGSSLTLAPACATKIEEENRKLHEQAATLTVSNGQLKNQLFFCERKTGERDQEISRMREELTALKHPATPAAQARPPARR